MSNWQRSSDGTWTRGGWKISRTHLSGSGQSKPFAHVNVKAVNVWSVYDPSGYLRTGGDLLRHAKANADRQMELRA